MHLNAIVNTAACFHLRVETLKPFCLEIKYPRQVNFVFYEQFVSFGMRGLKEPFCTFMSTLAAACLTPVAWFRQANDAEAFTS